MEQNCIMNDHMSKSEMLRKIQETRFSIIELGLYLNTNPEDKEALYLHNKYANTLNKLTTKYESMYGPLSIECPCNSWRWLDNPWPWEEGGN